MVRVESSPWSPVPGVWTAASDATFAGTITLSGGYDDVWVFQVGRDMTFSGSVIMAGNAQSCNVFWQIGRDATIASGSTFVGTLIASRDITVVSGATVDGRIISLNSSLTTDGNTVFRVFFGPAAAGFDHDQQDGGGRRRYLRVYGQHSARRAVQHRYVRRRGQPWNDDGPGGRRLHRDRIDGAGGVGADRVGLHGLHGRIDVHLFRRAGEYRPRRGRNRYLYVYKQPEPVATGGVHPHAFRVGNDNLHSAYGAWVNLLSEEKEDRHLS